MFTPSPENKRNKKPQKILFLGLNSKAVRTGLEPATSAVTGRHSNQLNYRTNNFRTVWDGKNTDFLLPCKFFQFF